MVSRIHIFLAFVLVLSGFIAFKKSYSSFNRNIFVSVFQQSETPDSFDNKKNTVTLPFYFIDELYFPPQWEMTHSKLGGLRYNENLHVDIEMLLQVNVEGEYIFKLETDSGIEMSVNAGEKRTFLFPDEIKIVHIAYNLKKGLNKVRISTIHREKGSFILIGKYHYKGSSEDYLIGESSEYIEFIEFEEP